MTNRREFIVQLGLGAGVSALASGVVYAQAVMLKESDPQAGVYHYKADGTKVDKTKFPKFTVDQKCSNCALFQGKASDKAGGCPLFAGKQVAAAGWCNAYAKKA